MQTSCLYIVSKTDLNAATTNQAIFQGFDRCGVEDLAVGGRTDVFTIVSIASYFSSVVNYCMPAVTIGNAFLLSVTRNAITRGVSVFHQNCRCLT